jgi:ribosomal protein S18 acetylase RimI-like enzyme
MKTVIIDRYVDKAHRSEVIGLWQSVFAYDTPHNQPSVVIDKKLEADDGLFFVAVAEGTVAGTIMAGYDGHRGWIYSVAVAPGFRRQGIGSQLISHAERALTSKGCVKINLQIMEGNETVVAFYESAGYAIEKRISMGKRLEKNLPRQKV